MDMFPELFAGGSGLSSVQFAIGMGDQTGGATNQVVELYNPALTGTAQAATGNVPLLTLVGIIASVSTANADLGLFSTATSNVVAGAASAGPQWLDARRSDTPTATFKMGQVANPGAGRITTIPLQFGVSPVLLPFNYDMSPGMGFVASISGVNRGVITLIWIERVLTN